MIALVAMLVMSEPTPFWQKRSLELSETEASAWLAANYPDCEGPKPDDVRPYTVCLSETDFERAEAEMQREWVLTLARVRASEGSTGERSIQSKQRHWVVQRDRKCENFAKDFVVTYQGRKYMDCLAEMTTERTALLKSVAR
ncbi:MAG: hypothetical protein DI568_01035 [Sphingomonas sp.]|nr:MAG: hypothetical protein DI568_01035 [Sphingomonas sp.]